MPELRGALIGCGFFAQNHLHAWQAVEGAKIVAVCDVDSARADSYRQVYGAERAFTDAAQMLTEMRPDFVDVVTQPGSHRALVELAASHGVAVICQKPLAPTWEDARAAVAACRSAGVPFMVHENFRWQRPLRAVKTAAEGIGALFFGRVSFRTPYDVYANQPYLAEDPRFIIADLGVHLLDLARFYAGEVESLVCHTHRVNPRIRGEDAATILLKMRNGSSMLVDVSYASKLEEDLFPQTLVHLEGAQGSVTLGPHYQMTVVDPAGARHEDVSPTLFPWSRPPGEAPQESVLNIQRHWVECLRTGRAPETSGEDNLRTLELVFGAYESAEQDRIYRAGELV